MSAQALNECVICERMFLETDKNPGCICEECREKDLIEKGEQCLKGDGDEN